MVVGQYVAMRHHFAEVARTSAVSLTYVHSPTPSTITRASGSFVTDGFEAGMTLQVIGTTDSDALYEIATVTASTITIVSGQQFNSSETIVSSLVGAFYELDGMEQWPLDLVRANGFDDGFTPDETPMSPFPMELTVNGNVADSVAGTSYKWYLSQRTETVASQHFTMAHADSAKTGTVTLALTSTAVADLGLDSAADALNLSQRTKLLKYVYVFCKRDSDGAIQQAHLLGLSDAQPV